MEKQELRERLKILRKQHNITQKKLAEYLNITNSGYSNYEQGISTPDISMLEKLAKLYNITLDELIYGKDNNLTPLKNKITLIGRNGTVEEYILSDEEMSAYQAIFKNRENYKNNNDVNF